MLKSEIEILIAAATNRCTNKQVTSHSVARSNPYVILTIDSLIRHGYIFNSESNGYQLTAKGAMALLEFLHDNSIFHDSDLHRFLHERLSIIHQSRTHEAIKLLDTLGTEYVKKLEELNNQQL